MHFVERRKSPRIDVLLVVRYAGSRYIEEHVGNVGFGGFAFLSDNRFKSGSQLEIAFQLPGTCFWVLTCGVILGVDQAEQGCRVRGQFEGSVDLSDFFHQTILAVVSEEQRGTA